jgi:hypothetical protein
VKNQEQVSSLINCLTNDEDLRQELWVHYLSGNPVDTFASHIKKIKSDFNDDESIKQAIWNTISNPPSDKFLDTLNKFTDFEKSIIVLLALGVSVSAISQHKGISEVRIKQTISSIRYNAVWEETYGIKEKP